MKQLAVGMTFNYLNYYMKMKRQNKHSTVKLWILYQSLPTFCFVTLSKVFSVHIFCLEVTKYGKVSWIFYERLSVRSINSSLPLPNKYLSQILNVARCTKIEKRFWLACIMHVLATFLLATIVNYYACFSRLFLIQTDFQDQTQFWMWRRYETHGNKSNKVKFRVIGVLKLLIHSRHCFFFRLNCVLLRYFRIHSFHQDHAVAASCLPSKILHT